MMPKIKENDWILIPAGTPICTRNYPIPRPFRTNDVLQTEKLVRINHIYDNTDYGVSAVITLHSTDFTISADSTFHVHKWPTVSREISNQITKGSVWETIDDTLSIKDTPTEIDAKFNIKHGSTCLDTLMQGTRIEVIGKPYIGGLEEKYVPVLIEKTKIGLSIKTFASMRLVEEGATKTYWKLLDKDDNPVTSKRFANLGNVKSSVRYHTGSIEYNEQDPDDSAPYWITDGVDKKTFDDWKAVHYKYDDTIIETVDLGDWFTIHKLVGKK